MRRAVGSLCRAIAACSVPSDRFRARRCRPRPTIPCDDNGPSDLDLRPVNRRQSPLFGTQRSMLEISRRRDTHASDSDQAVAATGRARARAGLPRLRDRAAGLARPSRMPRSRPHCFNDDHHAVATGPQPARTRDGATRTARRTIMPSRMSTRTHDHAMPGHAGHDPRHAGGGPDAGRAGRSGESTRQDRSAGCCGLFCLNAAVDDVTLADRRRAARQHPAAGARSAPSPGHEPAASTDPRSPSCRSEPAGGLRRPPRSHRQRGIFHVRPSTGDVCRHCAATIAIPSAAS